MENEVGGQTRALAPKIAKTCSPGVVGEHCYALPGKAR